MRERDIFEEILEIGKRRGVLTYDEINEALPSEFFSPDELEDLMDLLHDMGVKVVDNEEVTLPEEEIEEEVEEYEKTEDLVQAYFHSMGDISILTRYEETELAKKLEIEMGDKASVVDCRKAVLELRANKGMLLSADDHDSWSAGSFFTNPIVSQQVADSLPNAAPKWPLNDGSVKISAAWLIEHSGIHKGDEIGGARISNKHVLALTNSGTATASDIAALAKRARDHVQTSFGITLVAEVNLIGIEI